MPVITKKAQWALKWLASDRPLAERLVAFACVEGIFFSSSFCAIYWLKDAHHGLLPGLTFSNELISRDEGLHTDFATMLYRKYPAVSPAVIREIVGDAVAIEIEFATTALPVSLIGMNADLMTEYIKFVADRLLRQFDCGALYSADCPFDFMERLGLQNKTNFHEKKVAEYRKASVGASATDTTIDFNSDF
jgi:ribonucleoside-diphosphate reductase beta chain